MTERFVHDELQTWVGTVLAEAGARQDHAEVAARFIIRTSLRGIDTHGLARLPVFVRKLLSADVNGRAELRLSWQSGLLMIDADRSLGHVAMYRAMCELSRRVRQYGSAMAFVRNLGHFGASGVFALIAAEEGNVALVCTHTPPIMALPGFSGRAIGNNPLAFAFPYAAHAPIVFDMSASRVARGKIDQAVRENELSIPEGWAVGPDGRPTSDPVEALAGSVLPLAEHKGIGLAMMVQILAGSLSGAGYQPESQGGVTGRAGAFVLVLSPDLISGREAFAADVEAWLGHYLSRTPDGRYPGARAHETELERLEGGIPISSALQKELTATAASVGVPFNLTACP